ncbi:transcriptional regulator, LysR family [Aliiroseovarius sediminilitoris]|uniref:Transcriptional regulator, LysR family n=1 Tax=Aliiroseovarius sediminilitoris TaxID=1173584 RepID=A0A1I0QP47_9RHOB|nr:LysR family transcriptional regulator [Aliiroseovarius sediminilitoris]SEW28586.1 transcriptional regulator, LysR family [Aliiroseovarius sediminilitoris]
MNHWDEIRTAYHVARAGTVSGAAEALGIHHATVIRHIDALEHRLGVKLFQRHARGYTPTEAGADLARIAQVTEDQFTQLEGRLKGQGDDVAGDLVITALPGFSARLAPVLTEFQSRHPGLRVQLLTGPRIFKLEYGEAHVAIRAGTAPQEPDNVVQPFLDVAFGLYAAQSYIDKHDLPTEETLADHRFIGTGDLNSRAPFMRWLAQNIPAENVRFQVSDDIAMREALIAGAGLGFAVDGSQDGLVRIIPSKEEWKSRLWLVTHVDLHRSTKVQAILAHLKAAARQWAKDDAGLSLP